MHKATMYILIQMFFVDVPFPPALGKYLGVELVGHRAEVCFSLEEAAKLFC